MFKTNKRYLGQTIEAKKDNDNIVLVGGQKVRVKKTLKTNDVYAFKEKHDGMTIVHYNDSWGMTAEDYDKLKRDGSDVINRIFGDIIK